MSTFQNVVEEITTTNFNLFIFCEGFQSYLIYEVGTSASRSATFSQATMYCYDVSRFGYRSCLGQVARLATFFIILSV